MKLNLSESWKKRLVYLVYCIILVLIYIFFGDQIKRFSDLSSIGFQDQLTSLVGGQPMLLILLSAIIAMILSPFNPQISLIATIEAIGIGSFIIYPALNEHFTNSINEGVSFADAFASISYMLLFVFALIILNGALGVSGTFAKFTVWSKWELATTIISLFAALFVAVVISGIAIFLFSITKCLIVGFIFIFVIAIGLEICNHILRVKVDE